MTTPIKIIMDYTGTRNEGIKMNVTFIKCKLPICVTYPQECMSCWNYRRSLNMENNKGLIQ